MNAELAANGMSGLEGEALTAAKAQAIMGLATEQAGGALGQYARESDTVAGQQATLNATWEDAQAALGEALLPVLAPVIGALGDLAGWIQENAAVVGPLIAAVAALAAGILILNVVMAANPIGLIIAAVAALVIGIIALWNTNEDFRNFFIDMWTNIASFFESIWSGIKAVVKVVADFFVAAWNVAVAIVTAYIQAYVTIFRAIFEGVRSVVTAVASFFADAWRNAIAAVQAVLGTLGRIFNSVLSAILAPINWIVDAFNNVVAAIRNVINWLGRIKIPDVLGAIGGILGGKSAPATAGFVAPAGFSARSAGAVATPRSITTAGATVININGGLDSADTIARRVQQLIARRDRRAGGVVIARATT